MGQQDWSARGNSQAALDAAQQGLPAPEVLQQLRGMTLEEAVKFYNRHACLGGG